MKGEQVSTLQGKWFAYYYPLVFAFCQILSLLWPTLESYDEIKNSSEFYVAGYSSFSTCVYHFCFTGNDTQFLIVSFWLSPWLIFLYWFLVLFVCWFFIFFICALLLVGVFGLFFYYIREHCLVFVVLSC